jgi:hypothetical protein
MIGGGKGSRRSEPVFISTIQHRQYSGSPNVMATLFNFTSKNCHLHSPEWQEVDRLMSGKDHTTGHFWNETFQVCQTWKVWIPGK